jgi:hypothetical protein
MSDEPTATTTRKCAACGKPTRGHRFCSRGCWIRSPERQARLDAWRAAKLAAGEPIDPPPPSPEEIAMMTAEIRRGWSPADYADRAPHWAAKRWEMRMVPYAGSSSAKEVLGCL